MLNNYIHTQHLHYTHCDLNPTCPKQAEAAPPSPSMAKGLLPSPASAQPWLRQRSRWPSTGRCSPCNQYWLLDTVITLNLHPLVLRALAGFLQKKNSTPKTSQNGTAAGPPGALRGFFRDLTREAQGQPPVQTSFLLALPKQLPAFSRAGSCQNLLQRSFQVLNFAFRNIQELPEGASFRVKAFDHPPGGPARRFEIPSTTKTPNDMNLCC